MESVDFTHSSRKTCHTINRLTGKTSSKLDMCSVSANAIASQLYQNVRFINPYCDFSRQVWKDCFEAKEGACARLVDLTAVYDTVWHRELTLKLLRMPAR